MSTQVFIAPGSREHINRNVFAMQRVQSDKLQSIQGAIPISSIRDVLSTDELEKLQSIFPDGFVRMWGAKPGLHDIWDALGVDDVVVFYTENYYICHAREAYKTINAKLAERVWNRDRDGQTWECVFFIKNVSPLNMRRQDFSKVAGYSLEFKPGGFMQVKNESARLNILKEIVKIVPSEPSGFRFTQEDFGRLTGKQEDAYYLQDRFKTLLSELKKKLKGPLEDFDNPKAYVARPIGQSQKTYRDYMWLGLGHSEISEPIREQIQLQAFITKQGYKVALWIAKEARAARRHVRKRAWDNLQTLMTQLHSLHGYEVGYLGEENHAVPTDQVNEDALRDLISHFGDPDARVFVSKTFSPDDTIEMGATVVDQTIFCWSDLLPTHGILAFGESSQQIAIANTWSAIDGMKLESIVAEILHGEGKRLEIEPDTVRRVITHLIAGKHAVLIGPPGTGKSDLALRLLSKLSQTIFGTERVVRAVASYEWGRYDVIGGNSLNPPPGTDPFHLGCVTKAIREEKLLLIDEFNRADMNKAFGEMFLAIEHGQVDLRDDERPLWLNPSGQTGRILIPSNFRIVCTMNDYDKSLLNELSYGLLRRFAFVEVDVPKDISKEKTVVFERVAHDLESVGVTYERGTDPTLDLVISRYFEFINAVRSRRKIGVSTSMDAAKYVLTGVSRGSNEPWALMMQALTDYLVPQLDRLDVETIAHVRDSAATSFRSASDSNPHFEQFILELQSRVEALDKLNQLFKPQSGTS